MGRANSVAVPVRASKGLEIASNSPSCTFSSAFRDNFLRVSRFAQSRFELSVSCDPLIAAYTALSLAVEGGWRIG